MAREINLYEWHPWFSWRPVIVEMGGEVLEETILKELVSIKFVEQTYAPVKKNIVWLKYILRQRYEVGDVGCIEQRFRYKMLIG